MMIRFRTKLAVKKTLALVTLSVVCLSTSVAASFDSASAAQIEDGTYSGKLSCGPLQSNQSNPGWTVPLKIEKNGQSIAWSRGDDKYHEEGQAKLADGSFNIDAVGSWKAGSGKNGSWRDIGTVRIEGGAFFGSTKLTSPDGTQTLRSCSVSVPVRFIEAKQQAPALAIEEHAEKKPAAIGKSLTKQATPQNEPVVKPIPVAVLNVPVQSTNDKSQSVGQIAAQYVGKGNDEILRDKQVVEALNAIIPKQLFAEFEQGLGFSSLEQKDGFILASGCAPHSCTYHESMIAIHEKTGAVFASMLINYRIQTFGPTGVSMPDVINAWVKETQREATPESMTKIDSTVPSKSLVPGTEQVLSSQGTRPVHPIAPTVSTPTSPDSTFRMTNWIVVAISLMIIGGTAFLAFKQISKKNQLITTLVPSPVFQDLSVTSALPSGIIWTRRKEIAGAILGVWMLVAFGYWTWQKVSPTVSVEKDQISAAVQTDKSLSTTSTNT
ncbi:MAG: hypothetical protein Q7T21_02640, partial [Gallionella sp.]|nr:hypothetical protein [Gallionella sp.]